jgi:hypothetical protein
VLGPVTAAVGVFWGAWKLGEKIAPLLQPVFDQLYGWLTGTEMALNRFANEAEASAHRAQIAMEGAARAANLAASGATRMSDEEWSKATGKPASERPPALPGRASGGPGGGVFLVGENGPEIAAIPRGAYVLSHSDTMKAATAALSGGGGGQSVTIQFNGDMHIRNDNDIRRLSQELMADVQRGMRGLGMAGAF